jgi:hypothetical protein
MIELRKSLLVAGILLCCFLQSLYAAKETSALLLHDVKFTVEDPSGRLPKGQDCILSIKSVGKKKSIRTEAVLSEPETISLPKGEYTVNALIENPRYDARAGFSIPSTDVVNLKLEELKIHRLKVKILDEQDTPLKGCRIQLSFWGNVIFRHLPRLVGSAGTGKTEVTDANGLVSFQLKGLVPECNVRIPDQHLNQPDIDKVPVSSWDKEEPFILRVSRKIVNGKIECFFRKNKKIYPFLQGVTGLLGTTPRYVVARLMRGKFEHNKKSHFDFRLENNLLPLYGLSDGEYFVRRLDVISVKGQTIVYPFRNDPINIKNGVVSPADKKLVFAEKHEREILVTITVTDGEKAIADAMVSVSHPLVSKNVRTAKNGQCSVRLPAGKYKLQAHHNKFAGATKEVYIDSENNKINMRLEALPLLKGKITFDGKPVKKTEVIAIFDLDRYQFPGRTDDEGNYEIPLKRSGHFIFGVRFDGFTEFRELNTAEATLSDVNIELTPRTKIAITISGKYSSVIGEKARLVVFPGGIGVSAGNYDMPKSGVSIIKIIEGSYRVFLFVSENQIYALGTIKVAETQEKVTIILEKEPKSIDMKSLIEELRSHFKK